MLKLKLKQTPNACLLVICHLQLVTLHLSLSFFLVIIQHWLG